MQTSVDCVGKHRQTLCSLFSDWSKSLFFPLSQSTAELILGYSERNDAASETDTQTHDTLFLPSAHPVLLLPSLTGDVHCRGT